MTLADLIVRLRTLGKDTTTSNLINRETLKPKPDGTRLKFYVDNKPIVTGSVFITKGSGDANFRVQTGFTVDLVNAIITYSVAPVANVSPFEADYNFYWFNDTDHTAFLNQAAPHVSVSDPTLVANGLLPAFMQFALYYYWMSRATQYARLYGSSGGMASESVEEVTKAFKSLADTALEAGEKFRDEYYEKLGQAKDPASAQITYKIDPYTPKR